jgi:hypothetical protein
MTALRRHIVSGFRNRPPATRVRVPVSEGRVIRSELPRTGLTLVRGLTSVLDVVLDGESETGCSAVLCRICAHTS